MLGPERGGVKARDHPELRDVVSSGVKVYTMEPLSRQPAGVKRFTPESG